MGPGQRECYALLCDLLGGEHHLVGRVARCGDGIAYTALAFHAATFDNNQLTRLVVMAHDRCIRAELSPRSGRSMTLTLHKRAGRDGRMFERHPTMEVAVAAARGVPAHA